MKLYVAASWRNKLQPQVVRDLRAAGHEVYDFRDPEAGGGFAWSDIDQCWKDWTPALYRARLDHPRAVKGYANDKAAMDWAEGCILVLPSGASAHSEAAFMAGEGKPVAVLVTGEGKWEPELMYKLFDAVCVDMDEVLAWAKERTP